MTKRLPPGPHLDLLLEALDAHASEEVILASNTSALPIGRLAAARGLQCGVKYAEGFRPHLGHGFPREDHLTASLGKRVVKTLPWKGG